MNFLSSPPLPHTQADQEAILVTRVLELTSDSEAVTSNPIAVGASKMICRLTLINDGFLLTEFDAINLGDPLFETRATSNATTLEWQTETTLKKWSRFSPPPVRGLSAFLVLLDAYFKDDE